MKVEIFPNTLGQRNTGSDQATKLQMEIFIIRARFPRNFSSCYTLSIEACAAKLEHTYLCQQHWHLISHYVSHQCQWLMCIIAVIGFTFDIYEILMLPLIVRPALETIGGLQFGSPAYNQWRDLFFYLPAVSGSNPMNPHPS
jgi:hypothetical protein